nr:reverse transcriptase domain-containing protein [Tanacetum cinerariifolium]
MLAGPGYNDMVVGTAMSHFRKTTHGAASTYGRKPMSAIMITTDPYPIRVRPDNKANGCLYLCRKSSLITCYSTRSKPLAAYQPSPPTHIRHEEYVREGASSIGLGQANFRCSLTRVLRQELPSAFTNHSRESTPREGAPIRRRSLEERLESRHARNMSRSPEPSRGHSESPRKGGPERITAFKRLEKGVFHMLGDKGKDGTLGKANVVSDVQFYAYQKRKSVRDGESMEEFMRRYKLECRDVKGALECMKIFGFMHGITNPELIKRLHDKIPKSVDEMMKVRPNDKANGNLHQSLAIVQDPSHLQLISLVQSPEPRRCHSESPRKGGLERITAFKRLEKGVFHMLGDKGKAAAKMERWAEPTWCQMFNSTLIRNVRVWFDDLLKESINSYNDLKEVFLEKYLQKKKCMVEIHNIKQRDGESIEEFMRRYKLESRDVKGALECMKIFRFIHGITNPELIKRLHDKIPKSVDEIMKRVAKQKITQTLSSGSVISFSPLGEEDGTEGHMIIEAEIGGHFVHRMYVDGEEGWKELCGLLRHNLDMFAWKPADVTRVPWHIAEHRLNVHEGCLPIRK